MKKSHSAIVCRETVLDGTQIDNEEYNQERTVIGKGQEQNMQSTEVSVGNKQVRALIRQILNSGRRACNLGNGRKWNSTSSLTGEQLYVAWHGAGGVEFV